jgi:hypothetical protein
VDTSTPAGEFVANTIANSAPKAHIGRDAYAAELHKLADQQESVGGPPEPDAAVRVRGR